MEDQLLTLELRDGHLRHTLQQVRDVQPIVLELSGDVSDGRWHTVYAFLRSHGLLGLSLLDPSCTPETCHKETLVEAAESNSLPELGSGLADVQSVYIGGTDEQEHTYTGGGYILKNKGTQTGPWSASGSVNRTQI